MSDKMQTILTVVEDFISNKKFYELEQRLKTYISRFNNKKNYSESVTLLTKSLELLSSVPKEENLDQIITNITDLSYKIIFLVKSL